MTSDWLPGDKGTIRRIGLLGKFCFVCANAGTAATAMPVATAAKAKLLRVRMVVHPHIARREIVSRES